MTTIATPGVLATDANLLKMAETYIHSLVAQVDGRGEGCEPASIIVPEIYKELVISISEAPSVEIFAFWSVGDKGRRHVRVLDGKEIVVIFQDMYDETARPGGIHYDEFAVEIGQRPKRSVTVSYMTDDNMSDGEQALYHELRASGLIPEAARATVALHGRYATTDVGDYIGAGGHVQPVGEIDRKSR